MGLEAPESLITAIDARTEGNPLFLGEVVRLLAQEGRLSASGDPGSLRLGIPQGVREAIDVGSAISRRVQRVSRPGLRARPRVPPRRARARERAPGRGRARASRRGDRSGSDRRGPGRPGSSAVLARARPRHAHEEMRTSAASACTPGSERRSSISTRRTSKRTSQSSRTTSSRRCREATPSARSNTRGGRAARGPPAGLRGSCTPLPDGHRRPRPEPHGPGRDALRAAAGAR